MLPLNLPVPQGPLYSPTPDYITAVLSISVQTKIKKFKPQFVYSEPRIRVSNWCLPCTLARAHTDCLGGFEAISSLHGENAAAKLPHPKEQAVPSALFQHCLAWQAEFNQFQGLLKAKTTNPIVNAQGSDPCVIANIPQFPLTSHPENGE